MPSSPSAMSWPVMDWPTRRRTRVWSLPQCSLERQPPSTASSRPASIQIRKWRGLTEETAKQKNRKFEVVRFAWTASGRAATLGRTEGLTKLLIDPNTQRVSGLEITGANARELIAEGVVAVEMAAVAEDLAQSIHPHPSLSEALGIATEIYLDTATDLCIPTRT